MNRNIATKVTDMMADWARKDADAQTEAVTRLGLPANNTAKDRAKAMGFDMDRTEYHGTKFDFDEFNPKQSTRVSSEHGDSRGATYMTDIPELANRFSMSLKNGVTETFDVVMDMDKWVLTIETTIDDEGTPSYEFTPL